jgi:hypothetical protein
VDWSVDDGAIASVRPRASDPGLALASAWLTGTSPGATTLRARVHFTDGVERPAPTGEFRIIAGEPPSPRSIVVAEGAVDVTSRNGSGVSKPLPLTLPTAGKVEITVDWTHLENDAGFFLWEGVCRTGPCPGRLVIEAQARQVKPRRESASLPVGPYSLAVLIIGGNDTLRYEVRLTPE